eukprot:2857904-Prymnesium_polylepis.1
MVGNFDQSYEPTGRFDGEVHAVGAIVLTQREPVTCLVVVSNLGLHVDPAIDLDAYLTKRFLNVQQVVFEVHLFVGQAHLEPPSMKLEVQSVSGINKPLH